MSGSWLHELPAYSPISARAIARAAAASYQSATEETESARRMLADMYTADRVELVDSGRSALTIALRVALSADTRRRVVAMPAFQCYEVATAVVAADCDVVPYDVDPGTLAPDLDSLQRSLLLGASVAIIAPLYGLPVAWEQIKTLCDQHGVVAIEDAAQAHGASWRGQPVGSFADLSVLSFGRGKGWTGAGGGALLLRRGFAERYHGCDVRPTRVLRSGKTLASSILQMALSRPVLYGVPASIPALGLGQTIYHEPTAPEAMSPVSAALLTRVADRASHEANYRRTSAARWMAELPTEARRGVPVVINDGTAGYLRFPLRLPQAGRALGHSNASRRAGLASSYPRPLTELPPIAARLLHRDREFRGAETLARELITLPTHSRFNERARERLRAIISSSLTTRR